MKNLKGGTMKKLLIVALLILWASSAFAVGTCTQAPVVGIMDNYTRSIESQILTFSCTGDASSGSFPATAISSANMTKLAGWYLYTVETKPGGTAPTTLYDITLVNGNGYDVTGGKLADRSAATAERVNLGYAGAGYPVVDSTDTWTWTTTNNSVASATYTATLVFKK